MIKHNDIDSCKQGSLCRTLVMVCWRANVIRGDMIHKDAMLLLRSVWTYRELYKLHTVICLTYFQDGSELINIKTAEVTYMQEDDPLAVTFPAMKAEQEVSCISVCPGFTDVQLFLVYYRLPCPSACASSDKPSAKYL